MPEGGVTYQSIAQLAAKDRLEIFGAFHPSAADACPDGAQTLLMLGPSEPGFWAHFKASPEAQDGEGNPLDRWSARVINAIAGHLGAQALFPYDGPPWHPFIAWALRSRRAWESPVGFLVHDRAGLMMSYRGALALKEHIDLPNPPGKAPCISCAAPCLNACPVGALTASGYDVAACHSYLDTSDGQDCLSQGCAVRRACPVSQSYGRLPDQSAFHMGHFHPTKPAT